MLVWEAESCVGAIRPGAGGNVGAARPLRPQQAFASLVISFVLICLACGWTLVESSADKRKGNSLATMLRNPKSLLERGNFVGNVIALCLVGFVVLVTLGVFASKGQVA